MDKLFLSVLMLISLHCLGQAKLRKLPVVINHPAINVSAPYISLDGNSMIFISDNSDENQLTMFYTTKKDAVNWKEPMMMPKSINSRLNFLRGFALGADGKTLYLSSLKSGGLGGFDILVSQLKGAIWSEPINLGLPINSSGQEACPSLSPDETTIYFMRCEKMDQKGASGCKIFTSQKSRQGKWGEPIELPDYINTGNSQTPRILGDGETLIFSSDQLPQNKGGMDLYLTRLENDTWTQPVPLTFANTAKDDQYVSTTAPGRYLLKDQPGDRTSEIVEILFPADLKPKMLVKIEGVVSGIDNPSSPYIAVFNQANQEKVYNGRPEKDGSFTFYLKEGAKYEVSVEPEQDNYTYFSKVYDFTTDQIPLTDNIKVEIKPIVVGTEFELAIAYKAGTADLAESSNQGLRRLTRMVNGNPNKKFAIDVTLLGYLSDSIQSSPALTEIQTDTLHFSVERQIPDTVKLDSLLTLINDKRSAGNMESDSVIAAMDEKFMDQIDSLRKNTLKTVTVDSITLKKTYHNNRTEAQAKTLIQYLISKGAPAANLSYTNNALPEPVAENRRTVVKLKVVQ